MAAVTTALLSSGHHIPLVGLGTWRAAKGGEVSTAVETALKLGYKHIDCAKIYSNEEEIGQAFHNCFSQGVVKRDDVFITSKLWVTDYAPADVRPAVLKTLKDLQLEYLDLYLMHWPVACGREDPSQGEPNPLSCKVLPKEKQIPYIDTWKEMEKLVDEGLVKSIGVSNLTAKKLEALLPLCRIKPAVNQVEMHVYWRNSALLDYCKAHNIHITAYSPLGSPGGAEALCNKVTTSPLNEPAVQEIAAKIGKSTGQVLLRWLLQLGDISVVPKSTNPERIKSNLDVLSWHLSDADMATLSHLPTQVRQIDGSFFVSPDGPYQTLDQLWDGETDEAFKK